MSRRALLFVDVDGVLNPYAANRCPEGFVEHDFFPGEAPIRLCRMHGEWLHELAVVFDLVWGTAWNAEDRALLSAALSLPVFQAAITLPAGKFHPRDKVPAVDRLAAADRPAAWVDDLMTDEARLWAEQRSEPTLLVPVDPAVGLAREDVDVLLRWGRARG